MRERRLQLGLLGVNQRSFEMKDPFYRREQSNYEFPIASRESILDCLERLGEPVSFKRLAKMLDIENRRDREALKLRLRAMTYDGQLVSDHRNIYAIIHEWRTPTSCQYWRG